MKKIGVAIVDDQNLFRQSLAMLINSIANFTLAVACSGGDSFLDTLDHDNIAVDIALIDMDMPGMNGIQLNKLLRDRHPDIKVIILSVHVNEALISQMINAGAASYLAKNCDKDELVLAIDTVYKTGFYFNTEALSAIRNSPHVNHSPEEFLKGLPIALTRREQEILALICQELNSSQIAEKLFLSVRTVEGHRNNLIAKVNCRNTAGLVLFAIRSGLFTMPF